MAPDPEEHARDDLEIVPAFPCAEVTSRIMSSAVKSGTGASPDSSPPNPIVGQRSDDLLVRWFYRLMHAS